uniref:Uncharacterized protein n=1 Tax=Heterorhabditis bacteriophora TaxID=37862 RepID=A0A1I7XDX3_HETBA
MNKSGTRAASSNIIERSSYIYFQSLNLGMIFMWRFSASSSTLLLP